MSGLISFVTSTTTAGSGAATSASSLADNFDTFLTILTAQIQNQDPLEPLDSTQFTDQLVQFSGVEQQIKSNQQLESLITATHSSAGAALSGYLGQQAEINSTGAGYAGEEIDWRFALPRDAKEATITVSDKSGKVVYSRAATAAELAAGPHTFSWNGKTLDGTEVAKDNPYYIAVVAKDADGERIEAAHSLLATVSGVDLTYGEPALTTSAGVFSYADILRLTRQ